MSLTTQFFTMIAMIGAGSWLGAALDTYGRFLKRPKRAHFVVFFNDILFWIVQGLIIFYILLQVNEGELRFYVFIAMLCGYAAYQSLFRGYYIRFLEIIIRTSVSFYQLLVKTFQLFIVRPIKMLIQLLIAILLGMLNALLLIGKTLGKILFVLVKVCFAPIIWIANLLWRMIPKKMRVNIENIFVKYAGFLREIENMKHTLLKLWKKIRKS